MPSKPRKPDSKQELDELIRKAREKLSRSPELAARILKEWLDKKPGEATSSKNKRPGNPEIRKKSA